MIDDWAVSVKPSADPTIIKIHIEKMVEVSDFAPKCSPHLVTDCTLGWAEEQRAQGEISVPIAFTVLTKNLYMGKTRHGSATYSS